MRLTPLLAALTFLTLAFAGCSDGGDGDGETSSNTSTSQASTASSSSSTRSASATATTSSSSTGTGGPANQPPTGSVAASVNGTDATFTLTGTDPDGDMLVWELDFGDGSTEDGTTLPATVNHTYAAGNYTANFTVTDGKEPKTYSADIAAAASGSGSAPLQTVSGGWAVGVADSGATSELAACGSSPLSGVTHLHFAVDPLTAGKAFSATITDASDGAAIQDWGILFFAADCLAFEDASATGAAPIAGTVPTNAAVGVVIATGGAQLEFTYAAG